MAISSSQRMRTIRNTCIIQATILSIICCIGVVTCDFPFRNVSLSFDERVSDLVGRLTIGEIVQEMSRGGGGGDGGPLSPIERLGIGPYWWGTECIHGEIAGASTSFPQSIGMAAAFSPIMINKVASAISNEVRAKYNDFVSRGIYAVHTGLNCFSPVINIMRHPLWGRNQETYGEDPYLSGVYASEYVKGIKGDHPRYLRANTICKHFDAYGGPENIPSSRLSFDAKVSERDLHTTFLPQFKACVQSGAEGVMCSYNSVNGVPACVNKKLLTDILRTSWNFTGFVISDSGLLELPFYKFYNFLNPSQISGAVEFILINHQYIEDIQEAATACVKAGLNLELHAGGYARGVFDWLEKALNSGKLTKDELIERVKPLYYTRMRLGEFDPPTMNPYSQLNLSVVQSQEHRDLALYAAMQSFVLLKNDGLLPLKSNFRYKSIAIVGPFANNSIQQMGDYLPEPDYRYITTVVDGLSPLGERVHSLSGCDDTHCEHYDMQGVMSAVKDAEVVFLCLGTGQAVESEGNDRPSLALPGKQGQFLQDVMAFAYGRVVLLLFSASPVDTRLAQLPAVSAIIQCFFPAQSTGRALYNVITNNGPGANPAGRLPFTWYKSDEQVPSMTNYSMVNRTYRYFDGDPLYPFGYGLSYTQFAYSDLELSPTKVKAGQNVTATFKVTNFGPVDGSEVTQVYISWLNATVPTPIYQLVGFNRTEIVVNQTVMLQMVITSDVMKVWIDDKGFVIEPGQIIVYVGGQLPGQKTKVPSNVLKAPFTIVS